MMIGRGSEIITMIGCTQMICYVILKRLITEGVVNKHPATCDGVYTLLPLYTVLSSRLQTAAVPSLPAGSNNTQDNSVASSAGGRGTKSVI